MPGPLPVILGVVAAVGAFMGIEPAKNIINRPLNWLLPFTLPQIAELLEMHYREILNSKELNNALRQLGFDDGWTSNLVRSSTTLLGVADLITAWRRGLITETEFNLKMRAIRYDQKDADLLKQVSEFFPSPPDLVRFAVREVYTPETVAKFEMEQDLPTEFLENAAKAGLPEEQAKNFWKAHWELPSSIQGFRMLHRGIIDESELKLLLKSLDVMPFWRDKMIALSFNPLTRVDVRRMYGLGVLDEAGVNKAYRDIGYNEDNAKKMTDFTIEFENDENKGITRSSVVSSYKKGAITKEELVKYLKILRFSDKVVDFWVNTAQFDRFQDMEDDIVDTEVATYVEGVIDVSKLTQNLSALGLQDFYIQDIVRKAVLKRKRRIKLPSKEDLNKWLGLDIIDQNIYTLYMLESGYRQEDIDLYIEANSKARQELLEE